MHQPQAFKPGGRRAKSVKIRNQNAFVIPEDDHADFAFAINQQTDLPVECTRQERDLARQIIADQIFRRDVPAVETFQRFDLLSAKS